jgi:hypothetical protein
MPCHPRHLSRVQHIRAAECLAVGFLLVQQEVLSICHNSSIGKDFCSNAESNSIEVRILAQCLYKPSAPWRSSKRLRSWSVCDLEASAVEF